jgi:hypothetical protein
MGQQYTQTVEMVTGISLAIEYSMSVIAVAHMTTSINKIQNSMVSTSKSMCIKWKPQWISSASMTPL